MPKKPSTDIADTSVKLSLGYKITWGVAGFGTSLISGIYGALLPIFFQDHLRLSARWIATDSA
ncbi:MAG: hypothetical protein E4H27_02930, partial [Anaerolineales bacterium]